MKHFLLGVICGLLLTGLAVVILIFAAFRFGDRKPAVSANSVLVVKLSGEVPERSPVEVPIPYFDEPTPPTVLETWQAMHRAADDPKIKAIMLEPRGVRVGWAKLQELTRAIETFKGSGKPIYAFLHSPHTADYYLATPADRMLMEHDDMIDVKGLRIEEMYFKNTLDKLGVKVQIEHAGKYKDYGDMYSRTSMTPETREVLNGFLDEWFSDLVTVIAKSRKRTPEEIAKLVDQGPFLASKAQDLGLVDDLVYEDEAYQKLKEKLKVATLSKTSLKDYIRSAPAPGKDRARIAFVAADGGISGANNADPTDEITTASMTKFMRQAADDDSIKGVILRVNSPGGDAIASDEILHQAKLLSKKKPMIISMSDYAASGGYMMSMTGDQIIAYPGTITGSIGVVFGKVDLRGLYDKVGVQKETLKRGKFADIDSDYQELTPAEHDKLREGIESTYKSFVTSVAEGRKRPYEDVEPLAQGRAWTGKQALEHGLVDESGGLDRAIEMIRKKAHIPDQTRVALIPFPERRSIFEELTSRGDDGTSGDAEMRAVLKHVIPDSGLRSWVRVFMDGGMLRVMPYTVVVR